MPANQNGVKPGRAPGSPAAQETFTHSVLSDSTGLLARLYALKNLANRWSPESESRLTEEAKGRLAEMVRDHARGARQHASRLKVMLAPLLDELAGAAEPVSLPQSPSERNWQSCSAASLHAAQELDRLLRAALTTTSQTVALTDTAKLIRQELVEPEAGIASLLSTRMVKRALSENLHGDCLAEA